MRGMPFPPFKNSTAYWGERRRERPRCRATEKGDELATFHCWWLPCSRPKDSTPRYGRRLLRYLQAEKPRPTGSTQRLERRLGDSEHDKERDRRRRNEIVRRCQVVAGNADQPSRDERSEAAEHRHRDVVAD